MLYLNIDRRGRIILEDKNLTLTSVVFECKPLGEMISYGGNLTLTSVVFE